MSCEKPVLINEGTMRVPCGRCVSCLRDHARMWSIRCLHEMSTSKSAVFLTLTYNDKYLPENNSLKRRHFVLYMKRLRKRLMPRKIKYYASGEYGEKYGRPHYHVCLFNVSWSDFDIVSLHNFKYVNDPSWIDVETKEQLGYVYCGLVNVQTVRYTAKYVLKKRFDKVSYYTHRHKKMEPIFQAQSQGLGLEWALKNAEMIKKHLYINFCGHKCAVPRYYRKKLGITEDDYLPRIQESWLETEKKLLEQNISIEDAYKWLIRQRQMKNRALERRYKFDVCRNNKN